VRNSHLRVHDGDWWCVDGLTVGGSVEVVVVVEWLRRWKGERSLLKVGSVWLGTVDGGGMQEWKDVVKDRWWVVWLGFSVCRR